MSHSLFQGVSDKPCSLPEAVQNERSIPRLAIDKHLARVGHLDNLNIGSSLFDSGSCELRLATHQRHTAQVGKLAKQ